MSDCTVRAAETDDLAALAGLLPAPGQGGSLLPAGGSEFLLVAERDGPADAAGRIAGCVRVRRGIGLDAPRYWYHVGCAVHAAPELRLFHRQRTLLLCNDLTGAWEIADLACDGASGDGAGQAEVLRQLLRAALRVIVRERAGATGADEPAQVVVELPGQRDVTGRSPFWQSLGRHFYEGDPLLAAERFGPAWRTHVASLLPREPLLVSFLSPAAQAAIGCPARSAAWQVQVLHEAGLRPGRCVTIDDAGPVYEGDLDTLAAALPAIRA
jgi:arginine N-succinyltransferase